VLHLRELRLVHKCWPLIKWKTCHHKI